MPKDIIFYKEKVDSFQPIIRRHLSINAMIEEMKNDIREASTVKEAVKILRDKYGFSYNLYIAHAIIEIFQIPLGEITKLLYDYKGT